MDPNDLETLTRAAGGNASAFRQLVEPYDRELRAYCYRMLGSYHDADDALQEAKVKAWKALPAYDGAGNFRAWLYRIASNTCLDDIRARRRRVLPPDVCEPTEPGPPTAGPRRDLPWIEPFPDEQLPQSTPETILAQRQSIRLAFIKAMQALPARQRAVLILREVLDWPASDVADTLEMTVPGVNSALQRARAAVAGADDAAPSARAAAHRSEIASKYARAWEAGDFTEVVSMLAKDAVLSMPPWTYWLSGREAITATFHSESSWGGPPRAGCFRTRLVELNGQPAVAFYRRSADRGPFKKLCFSVLDVTADGRELTAITTFVLPELFDRWGMADSLEDE